MTYFFIATSHPPPRPPTKKKFAFLSSIPVKYRKVNLGETFCLFVVFHSPHSLFNGLHPFLVQGKQRIALGYDLWWIDNINKDYEALQMIGFSAEHNLGFSIVAFHKANNLDVI